MSFLSNILANKRAILYSRVSTEDQAKGYSLPEQENHLQKWCERYSLKALFHFREDGASAKNFNRPEFNKILCLIQGNKNIVDYLLVTKWDRFSRNLEEALQMIKKFRNLGIVVNATDQWIDYDDPNHTIILAVSLATPQVENENRSNRTTLGMRQAKKQGRWLAKPPKGYCLVPDGLGKSKLTPNEDADFVREAFQKIAEENLSMEKVRKNLSEKGFNCGKSQFCRLLRNIVYIGKTHLKAYREEKEELVIGIHDPIVSEDLFYRVQDVLKKGTSKIRHKPQNELFSLKGFLICQQCNSLLTASFSKGKCGKRYPYYHCQKGSCPSRYPVEKVNDSFLEFLKKIKISPRIAELYHKVMQDVFKGREKNKSQQKTQLEKKSIELEKRLLKAELKFANDEMQSENFNRVKEVYEQELTEIQSQKATLQTVESNYSKYLAFGLSLLANLDFYYKSASMEVKQKMTSSILGKKLIFDGEQV